MSPRRNSKTPGKKEVKAALSKNGRQSDPDLPLDPARSGQSWFSLVVVLALVGLWSSMAVVYFDVVDYDSVLGKLSSYDSDGDGDFDLDDARVLLGLKSAERAPPHTPPDQTESFASGTTELPPPPKGEEPMQSHDAPPAEAEPSHDQQSQGEEPESLSNVESDIQEPVPLPAPVDSFSPDEPDADGLFSHVSKEQAVPIDSTGELVKEVPPQETVESAQGLTSSRFTQEDEPTEETEAGPETSPELSTEASEPSAAATTTDAAAATSTTTANDNAAATTTDAAAANAAASTTTANDNAAATTTDAAHDTTPSDTDTSTASSDTTTIAAAEDEKVLDKAKKKKPKLFNRFDRSIKAEIDAAEKLRKKGKVEEALQVFETLVQKFPQSPRARFGKAQAEDDVAERRRSNEMLLKAINSYREASELPDVTPDLLRAALRRRAERQQFLGRTRGAVLTLQRLLEVFPGDVSVKNELGVAHLLLGDNQAAKALYQQVLAVAPDDGFAKVHYGFILKSENKISESIAFLRGGLESGAPGTDDGRFYFHLGDALQRVGDPEEAWRWYQRGHQRGHFSSVWQRSLYNVEGLTARPWWTPRETGYSDLVKTLERNWRTVRDEALAVMDQKSGLFLPEEENLRETGVWGQYTLWQQGRKVGNACQSVPKTCALMERFPEATGCKRGQIKFSVMQPGTHVWPHTGPTNCRLRLHLGLVVPKTGCRIRVTDSVREWGEGQVLIFDDSFEHEVWQDAESLRLILIVDVWHPELTAHQRQTLSPI